MNSNSPVLLVEDNRAEQKATKRAFDRLDISNPLRIAENGFEALSILKNPELRKPCLILLDLDMPKMNGIEFLHILKSDQALNDIPVVVLMTSHRDKDVVKSSNLSVAGYLLKPVEHQAFMDFIHSIDVFWMTRALPSTAGGCPPHFSL